MPTGAGSTCYIPRPPSIEMLIDRLRRRGGDSPDQILRRLDSVVEEIRCIKEFDYVVVNREGRLDETVKQIAAIISAERFRTARRRPLLRGA